MALLLTIFCALFFVGIIIRTKSIASGRKGAGIFQPLKDVYVLFHKDNVFSSSTSILFQIAPAISLASVLTALLVVPFANRGAIISFGGDFIFFVYLLAIGKFFQIISALDVGSSFEGMGANREALYSMLVEPAFLILIATLAMLTGYTSFSEIFSHLTFTSNFSYIIALMAVYLLVQIAAIENSRVPVDDPKTHLELTMIHEVMVLDNCGFDMALIHCTTFLKFTLYGALIANCLLPNDWNIAFQIALFIAIQIGFAFAIGLLESFRARNKMIKNAKFILTLSTIALLLFSIVLLINNKLI